MKEYRFNREWLRFMLEHIDDVDIENDIRLLLTYIKGFKNKFDEIRELLKQPTPNYASCIKLLDEIERVVGKNE